VPAAASTAGGGTTIARSAERPGSARELAETYQKAIKAVEQRLDPDANELVAVTEPAPPVEEEKAEIVEPAPAPTPAFDPNVIVHQLQAWMPDAIATCKLRGFVTDNQGEVLESVPGKIKMRIGTMQKGFSWLGIGRKNGVVDLELRLERSNPGQQNLLHITVLMSSPHRKSADASWRERCNEVFCELRSYLAGVIISG